MASAPSKLSAELERIRRGSQSRLQRVPRGEYDWERPPFVVQELADTLEQAERWSRYLEMKAKSDDQAGHHVMGMDSELERDSCRRARGFIYQAQHVLVMCDSVVEAWRPGIRRDRTMQTIYVYSGFVSLGLLLGSWIMGRYAPIPT